MRYQHHHSDVSQACSIGARDDSALLVLIPQLRFTRGSVEANDLVQHLAVVLPPPASAEDISSSTQTHISFLAQRM